MASNVLGEIFYKIRTDSTDAINGIKKTQNAHKGLWQEVTKGITVFAIYQKAVQLITGFLKGAVKEYEEAERVHAVLVQTLKNSGGQLGLTAKQIEATSKAYQRMSIFGDEAITTAQTSLIKYGNITKEVFPIATKLIIDIGSKMGDLGAASEIVGRALERPSLGMRQLRQLGIIFSASQQKVITDLEKTGNIAGAQKIILDKLNATYGGMAATMRNTFGGAVAALKNNFSDLQENIGMFMTAIGKPLVETLNNIIIKINEFLESDKGFNTLKNIAVGIGAAFSIIWEVGKQLADTVFKAIGTAIQPIIDAFKKLFPEGTKATALFQIITGILKVTAIVITMVANLFGLLIQNIIDTIIVMEKSANVIRRFFEALTDPSNKEKWKTFADAGKEAGDAWKNMFVHIGEGIVKMVKDSSDGIIDLIKNTEKDADDLGKKINNTINTLNTGFDKLRNKIDNPTGDGGNGGGGKGLKAWLDTFNSGLDKIDARAISIGKHLADAAKTFAEKWKEGIDKVKERMDFWGNFATDVTGRISSIVSQASENALQSAENEYVDRKAYIEANVTDETERARQLEDLDKEYTARQKQLKKEAWIANQAIAVINSIINTALAVTNALANSPPPANFIMAAVVGAMGAVQTALIAAAPMPQFASGAYVPAQPGGMQATIGEGPVGEFVTPDKGPIWNTMADRIISAMDRVSGGNINNSVNFPNGITVKIGDREFYGMLTQASRDGKFSVSQTRGLSRRD